MLFKIGIVFLIVGLILIFGVFLVVDGLNRVSPLPPDHGGFGYTDKNGVQYMLNSCEYTDKIGNKFITPCEGQKDINLKNVSIHADSHDISIKGGNSN